MKPELRRIRRWLWNGAAVVSLVMAIGIEALMILSDRGPLGIAKQTIAVCLAHDPKHLLRSRGHQVAAYKGKFIYTSGEFLNNLDIASEGIHENTQWVLLEDTVDLVLIPRDRDRIVGGIGYREWQHTGARSQSISVPLYYPLAATAIFPTLWLILWYRGRYKRLPNHCQSCGYNLTGTLAAGRDECPECGKPVVV